MCLPCNINIGAGGRLSQSSFLLLCSHHLLTLRKIPRTNKSNLVSKLEEITENWDSSTRSNALLLLMSILLMSSGDIIASL